MKDIDIESWKRRETYNLFRSAGNPHFSITADINVTELLETGKATGIPLFNFTLYAIMCAVNSIPEFRTRFVDDRVFELPVTNPSFTVPIADDGFAFCELEFHDDWQTFNAKCITAVERAKLQDKLIENADTSIWTYLTCAPWVHFTGLTHATFGPDDCIPRIAWGKYTKRGNNWYMPLNVQAHHALLDGFHAAKLFTEAERILSVIPVQTVA